VRYNSHSRLTVNNDSTRGVGFAKRVAGAADVFSRVFRTTRIDLQRTHADHVPHRVPRVFRYVLVVSVPRNLRTIFHVQTIAKVWIDHRPAEIIM